MYLTKHGTADGPRWALDDALLPADVTLGSLLQLSRGALRAALRRFPRGGRPDGRLLAPVDPDTEVWAAGVTYLRSRDAREEESATGDVYARVYDAPRPELFWKAIGWRVVGHHATVRIRRDSQVTVPEPELTLVIDARGEIVGYCAGNDVSSRDIEGANPLYLPQAKVYDGSCALGPGILLADARELADLPIQLSVTRAGREVFAGHTTTARIRRPLEELVAYLRLELALPRGACLMTGTGIVPELEFTLHPDDTIRVVVGELTLENTVTDRPSPPEG